MSTAARGLGSLARRLASAVTGDLRQLAAQLGGPPGPATAPPTGLSTYRLADGGDSMRVHLQVQQDGSSLLFRDVTDVVHLSASATEMAWLALEQSGERAAQQWLTRRYGTASRQALHEDYQQVHRLVRTMTDPQRLCLGCTLELSRSPLFATRARAPHKVDLALTYGCNNRCPHCYNPPDRLRRRSLGLAEWKQVIERLIDLGVPHLVLTGGEPTLHPHLIELVAHADALGPIVGLNTNGRRLADPSTVSRLVEAGLNHVQVTLGSHDPEVHDAMVGGAAGAFGETVAGIQAALASPLHVVTNTTITRLNAEHMDETVAFLHELGVRTFGMNALIHAGGGRHNPDAVDPAELAPVLVQVRDTARELGMRFIWYTVTRYCELSPVELDLDARRCNAGEYSMCVEPNGDVVPCQSYYQVAGNLLRDDWQSIWDGDLFRSFRDREQRSDPRALDLDCQDCPDLPLCGGGCRLDREPAATTSTPIASLRSSGRSAATHHQGPDSC